MVEEWIAGLFAWGPSLPFPLLLQYPLIWFLDRKASGNSSMEGIQDETKDPSSPLRKKKKKPTLPFGLGEKTTCSIWYFGDMIPPQIP